MKRLLMTTCLSMCAVTAQAQDGDIDAGAGHYFSLCATCHGDAAKGGGPMTDVLTVAPPDLTALKRTNDGVFPTVRVAFRIDGRDSLAAHGGPMPLFGRLFEGENVMIEGETGQPVLIARGIADIIAWLKTVQE